MENKDKENKDTNELLEVADVSKPIKIAGEVYQFYPLSLGKIGLLTELLKDVLPIIKAFDDLAEQESDNVMELIRTAIDSIAGAVKILTHPNDGTEPPTADEEFITNMKFGLTPPVVSQILVSIKGGFDFKDMLKNVFPPKPEDSTDGSISLDG